MLESAVLNEVHVCPSSVLAKTPAPAVPAKTLGPSTESALTVTLAGNPEVEEIQFVPERSKT
jgi:hypothetical protein